MIHIKSNVNVELFLTMVNAKSDDVNNPQKQTYLKGH